MRGSASRIRLCRLCRNTSGWRYPTGDKQKEGGFPAQNGFGIEEWLDRREWTLRDEEGQEWRYAHIPSLARIAEQEADDPITLLLFICEQGRDGRQTFSIVGTIHQVWLTDEAEAQKAVETFIARGWLRTMREEAVQAGGVETELTDEAARACPRWYVTIRFRPDSLEWFHPSIKILEHKMRAQRMWRFTVPYIWKDDFLPAVGTAMTDSPSNEREASWISEEIRLRRAIGAKAYLPRQAPIQNRLARQLAQIYGPKGYRVLCEDNHVDISIRRGAYSSFLEIKPADSAREAIRLALGQLLEYAHYPKADRADNLVVVSDAAPGADDDRYIRQLREYRGAEEMRMTVWRHPVG